MSVQILIGDVRDKLRELPPDSVDCVVTSPPYYGLRDYGIDGQIGMERTLGDHISALVEVFREVRRVMRPKAALWINYGDCYETSVNGRSAADTKAAGNDDRTFRDKPFSTIGGIFKPKDLLMAPFRLAISLQEDGWWIRSRCVWGKPNGMPDSSGKYRPSVAHEEIFLLSKSGDLYYDAAAVSAPVSDSTNARLSQNVQAQIGSERANGGRKTNGNMKAVVKKQDGHGRRHAGFNERYFGDRKLAAAGSGTKNNVSMDAALAIMPDTRYTRYLRTYEPEVWHIATAAFSDAHFATFPPSLVERCLLASCPESGVVLDPFGGAGTTGLVADRMGLDAILIELNPEYAEIARHRLQNDAPLFAKVTA